MKIVACRKLTYNVFAANRTAAAVRTSLLVYLDPGILKDGLVLAALPGTTNPPADLYLLGCLQR